MYLSTITATKTNLGRLLRIALGLFLLAVFGYALLPFILFSLLGRGVRFLLVAGLVSYRHDFKLVLGFLSALLILIGTGMWLVS